MANDPRDRQSDGVARGEGDSGAEAVIANPDSFDTITLCLRATAGMLESATFNTAKMLESAELGYTTATRLADWLVKQT